MIFRMLAIKGSHGIGLRLDTSLGLPQDYKSGIRQDASSFLIRMQTNIKIRSDIKHLQQPSLILGNRLVRGVVVSFRLAVHFIYLFV